MPFLRKITGGGGHSRSNSNNSIKSAHSPGTGSLKNNSTSHSKVPSIRHSAEHHRPFSYYSHQFHSSGSDYTLVSGKSSPTSVTRSPISERNILSSSPSNNSASLLLDRDPSQHTHSKKLSHSRHSSSSSLNQNVSKVSKLIVSWDTADPDQWTLNRVLLWLKFHEFPECWINFIRKRSIQKQTFISLLAYENFLVYEKYLPQSKSASYDKFQNLLKLTMAQNVTNNHHIRQKSADIKLNNFRSISDSTKGKPDQPPSISDLAAIRSVSESALPINHNQEFEHEERPVIRAHHKAKSTDALYRRSFISLKTTSPSTKSHSRTFSGMKLNIPLNLSNETSNNSSKSASPPLSPSHGVLSRKQHKSTSSESSLLNVLLGSNGPNGSNTTNTSSTTLPTDEEIQKYYNRLEASSNKNPPSLNQDSKSLKSQYLRQSPVIQEERSSLWEKFKRRSQIGTSYTYPARPNTTGSLQSLVTNSKENLTTTASNSHHNTDMSADSDREIIDDRILQTPGPVDHEKNKGHQNDIAKTPLEKISDYKGSNSLFTPNIPELPYISQAVENLNSTEPSSNLLTETALGIHNETKIYQNITSNISESSLPPPAIAPNLRENLHVLDSIYLPQYIEKKSVFILITSDNKCFQPFDVSTVSSIEDLLLDAEKFLGLENYKTEVYLTDFNCKLGKPLSPELLKTCTNNLFINTTGKLYFHVLDGPIETDKGNSVSSKLLPDASSRLSVTRNESIGSNNNSLTNSNDQASITTSSSDIYSFDDRGSENGRRYPRTPSHYYDIPSTTSTGEEVNYWNAKEVAIKNNFANSDSNIKSVAQRVAELQKDDKPNEIEPKIKNFNKRRDSPFLEDNLAPKREAPKPPIDVSPSRALSTKKHVSVLHRGRSKLTRKKEIESLRLKGLSPVSMTNKSTTPETVISSYIPGSTNILVPQPYKGADVNTNKTRDEGPSVLTNSIYLKNKPRRSSSTLASVMSNSKSRKHINDEFSQAVSRSSTFKQKISRSSSIKSSSSSLYHGTPPLLKRGSTRRIISLSSAADVFDENNITFADAPELTDSDGSDDIIWNKADTTDSKKIDASDSSDDIIWTTPKGKEHSKVETKNNNEDLDSSSSDDIIWLSKSGTNTPVGKQNNIEMSNYKSNYNTMKDQDEEEDGDDEDDIILGQPNINDEDHILGRPDEDDSRKLLRRMTLRPSPEMVYQNLEKFFPQANLDEPVLEGHTPPASPRSTRSLDASKVSSPLKENISCISHTMITSPKPESVQNKSKLDTPPNKPLNRRLKRTKTIRTIAHEANEKRRKSVKLKRQNTKMWGTKVVEITKKTNVSINKSKNDRGEYKEFAWVKGELIGKGSFGSVYLSLNVTTGEMMAVKQVEVPEFGSQNEAIVSTVEALRSEVTLLKDLDHINIVQYLGFEKKNNIYSLFLEYVAGGSIGSLIRMYGRFDESLIRHSTTQILAGLSYLHSKGILHRDMKADNILLDGEGICKISDFGISRKSKDIYSNSEMTMRGTVFWMAPEMVDTKQGYSAKVDIWSLGCIILEMFAGKRPWSNLEVVAAMFKIGQSKSAPPIPEDTLPLISQDGRDFLDDCFKIDPEKRPTAEQMLDHLFSQVDPNFDFSSTDLVKYIRCNDKMNSTKLRVHSGDYTNVNH
ncbi:hypothetical protein TBLA_0C02940 [Henningerozyma blattae CBS 6284]|uniref:Protein kinase domain-containing protein n=1 Tax=Henningerozyma blattae (strain ATCC 34711 / CBS 6284 / DSM 70876 / NBRC 10599 / NRRL Y-10934 / UCD 77-7) TaxID=1071380 RepID=I2H146_HENB6|nr:hypothetical protein TBLA_0C02940 [Tetrapisispora blattae CBS 6284]CCH60098.1 hypothetical protein TBLA_0C02940 [Tetrapisispora blattae CBS 6284]